VASVATGREEANGDRGGPQDPVPPAAVRANERGIRLLLDREAAPAVEAFRAALASAPESRVVERNLAAALAALGERRRVERQHREAVDLLKEAVERHPSRLLYRVQLGRARFGTGTDVGRLAAREDLQWVLDRDSHHLDALVNLGQIEYIERRLEEAVRLWTRALELRSHDADVENRLRKARRELAVERSFRELRTRNFLLRYSPDVTLELATAVRGYCEEAYSDLSRRFQSYPDRVVVTLYTPEQFRSATRAHAWVAGLWDGTIRLTARPRARSADLRATIYHELTHHLVRSLARDVPVWLHEGLAQVAEEKRPETAEARLARGSPPRLEELDTRILTQRDPRRVSRFYDVALAFTASLRRERGDAGIQDLLRALGEGRPLDETLRKTFGESRRRPFRRWRDSLPD